MDDVVYSSGFIRGDLPPTSRYDSTKELEFEDEGRYEPVLFRFTTPRRT
jgi:hypothetical protein